MRNMSHSLTVSANSNGRLSLKIETNVVKLSVHFPDVTLESFIGISLIFTINKWMYLTAVL